MNPNQNTTLPTDAEIRLLYGPHAIISRREPFTFVHLDRPDVHTIDQRTREFDPAAWFVDDCAICQIAKTSGVIVFDEFLLSASFTPHVWESGPNKGEPQRIMQQD